MSDNTEQFKYKSLQDQDSVVNYLKDIMNGFDQNHLVLGNGRDKFVIEPHGLIKLDVNAKRTKKKTKITIRLTWTEDTGEKQSTSSVESE